METNLTEDPCEFQRSSYMSSNVNRKMFKTQQVIINFLNLQFCFYSCDKKIVYFSITFFYHK